MTNFTLFHLFSFVPILLIGSVIWFERISRQSGQRRTFYLFLSILVFAINGVFQLLSVTFRSDLGPGANLMTYMIASLLYLFSALLLEYAIHAKRIEESFLTDDFVRGLKKFYIIGGILLAIIILTIFYFPAFGKAPNPDNVFEIFFVPIRERGSLSYAYQVNSGILNAFFFIVFTIVLLISARGIFNLQQGVIRQKSYPFLIQLLVTVGYTIHFIFFDKFDPNFQGELPLYYFGIISLAFVYRLVEEFFFWSQYNLRSDRARIEQRQHNLNILIRKVISSPEDQDKFIVRENIDEILAKAKSRMVVDEYNITGFIVYRVHGNIIKVDAPEHLIGYCTPLIDNKSFKNLDKQKLNDQILKITYDIKEIRETPVELLSDMGKKLIKQLMTTKEEVSVENLPENFRGLQRLVQLMPILDGTNFMGFIIIFKDSFFKLYPAEKEVLRELTENLGTIFALMNAKEIQRERNRLQGEMNTARTIQTSILPKKIEIPGYTVGTFMETATEVGGDVYDHIPTSFGNYLGIGDVSGHGLPAGMMAVISMSAMHGAIETSRVLNKEIPIDALYEVVNKVLCVINRDRIGSDKFMTQNYFVEKNGVFHHSGTHEVALLYHSDKNEIQELRELTDKTGFLGLSEYVKADQSIGQFELKKGDMLLLYSDGVIEAKSYGDNQYNIDNLKMALMNHKDKNPQEIIQALYEELQEFAKNGDLKKNGGHFSDDVSMVLIRKD